MRHVVLFALAIAAAFWLAPDLHLLPQHAKTVAEVAIIGVFALVDLTIGLVTRLHKSGSGRTATRYATPARRARRRHA